MPVTVVQESQEFKRAAGCIGDLLENCAFCRRPTDFWYANGWIPVCETCAKKKTDSYCVGYSIKHKYVPNTRRIRSKKMIAREITIAAATFVKRYFALAEGETEVDMDCVLLSPAYASHGGCKVDNEDDLPLDFFIAASCVMKDVGKPLVVFPLNIEGNPNCCVMDRRYVDMRNSGQHFEHMAVILLDSADMDVVNNICKQADAHEKRSGV